METISYFSATCVCGWREHRLDNQVRAEVLADAHEARDVRRAYRHETRVEREEAR